MFWTPFCFLENCSRFLSNLSKKDRGLRASEEGRSFSKEGEESGEYAVAEEDKFIGTLIAAMSPSRNYHSNSFRRSLAKFWGLLQNCSAFLGSSEAYVFPDMELTSVVKLILRVWLASAMHWFAGLEEEMDFTTRSWDLCGISAVIGKHSAVCGSPELQLSCWKGEGCIFLF